MQTWEELTIDGDDYVLAANESTEEGRQGWKRLLAGCCYVGRIRREDTLSWTYQGAGRRAFVCVYDRDGGRQAALEQMVRIYKLTH